MKRRVRKAGLLPGPLKEPTTPDYVVVELRHDSQIAYSEQGFAAPAALEPEVSGLNRVLEGYRTKAVSSHFGVPARQVRRRVADAPSSLRVPVDGDFAHAGFVQVVPRDPGDAAALARRLNRNPRVWKAFVAPRPVPAGLAFGTRVGSRSFEATQGYLASPPNGIGAMQVWSQRGARGERVRICDIEGNWNLRHEDLPRGLRRLGGTPINDLGWRNHGTAVLGEMISRPGDVGTVGISHRAQGNVHSAIIGGVWNTGGAIRNAARQLRSGDVILIELQGTGPRGRYVAMQYWDDVFSAIRYATAKGVTVVEAAGNGNENFDLRTYQGTGLQKDSGAIVVGAGVPPTNWHDYQGRNPFGGGDPATRYKHIGVPRSRIWFSNYGRIVNVQAWGWHVTTLGYGDAQGGRSENRWYTLHFSGTSSASPIVTGAVACIQGRAKAVRGRPLEPKQVRRLLMRTGTPQEPGPRVPLRQRIGPQPNLPRAMRGIRR
jgi:hypothetical protein